MSQPPLTHLEQRWAAGYGRKNDLIQAATQNTDRKSISDQDSDIHRNVTNYGRRTLMTLGRWIYSNFPTVRGALHEQAEYSSSTFQLEFRYLPDGRGPKAPWKAAAEEWIWQHDKICNVAGWPYNARLFRRNLVIAVKRDGDCGVLLTETRTGYPQLQVIPAHRIGSRTETASVVDYSPYIRIAADGLTDYRGFRIEPDSYVERRADGTYRVVGNAIWNGRRILDGVILGDQGEPLAYRVHTENPWDTATFTDISSRSMMLVFVPEYDGQVRGFSALGPCLFDWQDIQERRRYHMLAEKINAAIALVEKNETGAVDEAEAALTDTATATDDVSSTATGLHYETLDGGTIRYLKAKSGAALEAHIADRPTENQQNFEASIVRSNFHGMDWSIDFSLDPTKVGGAPMRVVMEKINRAIATNQDLIIEPACRRYHGYALSKAMKLGLLDWDDYWHQFEYQGPAKLTADAKYDSDVDAAERRSGRKTLQKSTAEKGEHWLDVRTQEEIEEDDLLTRAARLAKKHGCTLEFAVHRLDRQNNAPAAAKPEEKPEQEPTEETEKR